MSFLIPLAITAAGKIGSNLINRHENNKAVDYQNNQTKYLQDQQGRDYTSKVNTQNNGIDYLSAVAQARGFKGITPTVIAAAHKLNGVTGPMSVDERFAKAPMAPKEGWGSAVLSPIAEGMQQYGGVKLGQAGTIANNNIANGQTIAQQIIQGVISGKIDPAVLQQLGIGGFDRILATLKGRTGSALPSNYDSGKPSFPNINPTTMMPYVDPKTAALSEDYVG